MHPLISNRARLYGAFSSRLRLTLLVALAWLALAAGPARADLIVYNFSGDTGTNPDVTLNGSFAVDTAVVQQKSGFLTAGDLQSPDFKISDGFEFKTFTTPFTFDVDTKSYDVISATLNLTSTAGANGPTLLISGSSAGGFQWVEQFPEGGQGQNGNGTISHTTEVSATPEPSALALLGLGTLCLAGYAWRRRTLAVA